MEKISFEGALGESLSARLDRPVGRPRAYALFAHCFTCGKDIAAASRIARSLAEKGIAVLRFDFTGLGKSEGEFSNTNFSSNIQDLIAAARYMRKELEAPSILVGHSLGGTAVLAAAQEIEEVCAVVTLGAPADAAHVAHHFSDREAEIMESGETEVCLAGRPFKVKKQFLQDIRSQSIEDKIKNLNKALLILHGPKDETVGIENAARIFQAAKHPKSFVTLDDADHLISRREDAAYAADLIASWSARYLEKQEEQQSADVTVPEGAAFSGETGAGKFQQKIRCGKHEIYADEPESHGGMDSGPSPYDFLKIGLAACKSMTLRLYANRKGWPMEWVGVNVRHDRIHAQDCEDCSNDKAKIDRFSCDINITGADLTAEMRERLLEISKKCPVHQTLSEQSVIESQLDQEKEP